MSDLYESLFRGAIYPTYESLIRRRKTLDYLRDYEANQWLSADEIAALQWEKLQALIAHCWEHIPFYRQWWAQAGVRAAQDIRDRGDYARLPVLTKPVIREHFEDLIAPSMRSAMYFKSTGGSTGEPLRFGYTRESYERRIAVMFRGYGWAGAQHGERTVYLWGAAVGAPAGFRLFKDKTYHAIFNRRMLNAFDLTPQRMAEYLDAINRFQPKTIVSYVGPLVALAEWIERNGRSVHRPQRLLGAAEALHPHQRVLIERVFGAPAYDTYGCREVMLIAAECEAHDGLHINADHLLVEFGEGLQTNIENDAARSSEAGHASTGSPLATPAELIITDLHNVGMPLMRYLNGDLGTPGKTGCSCGRHLPKLAKIDGRKLDALRIADGRLLPGEYFVNALMPFQDVRQYQIVQRQLDTLSIRLVHDDDFDVSAYARIRDDIGGLVGDSVKIEFERVDAIALTSSGKRRVTICELPA